MSVTVSLNGTTYRIPSDRENGWGAQVRTWIQAVSSSTLQKTGGTFTLTADVDFGSSYGLTAKFFAATSYVALSEVATPSTPTSGTRDYAKSDNKRYYKNDAGTEYNLLDSTTPPTTAGDLIVHDGTTNVRQAVGTDGQVLTVDTSLASKVKWATPSSSPTFPTEMYNIGLATSVGSNALTIALKQSDGSSDPSSGANAVKIAFRSSTSSSGSYVERSVTSSLSMTVSSGSTLGHASAVASYFYVYAIDNAGTVELAVSTTLFDDTTINSTTAEGGAGGADSYSVLYSTTARSNVAIRLLGRLLSTQATAGTWATAISEISLMTSKVNLVVPSIQTFTSGSGTYTTPTVRTPKYIRVRMVGGGGGGGGGAGAGSTSGSNGGGTTFGTSLLTANGGTGGTLGGGAAGTGGTASLGTGPIGTALSGAAGASCIGNANGGSGGWGGCSSLGGGGAGGGSSGQAAAAGVANTGGGGGGSGAGSATQTGGAGGGAGGFVDAIIISPLASYAYAVGAGGAAGTAGANASAAGAGGSGYIEVTEYYQ